MIFYQIHLNLEGTKKLFISKFFDLQNFFEYLSIEMYAANIDWGTNNIKMWNAITENDTCKWRWILYDIDNSYTFPGATTTYSTNSIKNFSNKNNITSTLFNHILEIEEFKLNFVATFCDFLNTYLDTLNSRKVLDSIFTIYEKGLDYQFASKYYNVKKNHFYAQVDTIYSFISKRNNYLFEFLQEYANDEDIIDLEIEELSNGKIKLSSNPTFPAHLTM